MLQSYRHLFSKMRRLRRTSLSLSLQECKKRKEMTLGLFLLFLKRVKFICHTYIGTIITILNMNKLRIQEPQIEENQLIKEYEYLNKKKEELKTIIHAKSQIDKIEEREKEISEKLLNIRKKIFFDEERNDKE